MSAGYVHVNRVRGAAPSPPPSYPRVEAPQTDWLSALDPTGHAGLVAALCELMPGGTEAGEARRD